MYIDDADLFNVLLFVVVANGFMTVANVVVFIWQLIYRARQLEQADSKPNPEP